MNKNDIFDGKKHRLFQSEYGMVEHIIYVVFIWKTKKTIIKIWRTRKCDVYESQCLKERSYN